ncbi:MFS transporter, partial [Bacillus cereus]|nr:MFS transporter [Bacillus cereus]
LVPISALIVTRITYRKLFLAAILLFTERSINCPTSGNLTMMMTRRVIKPVPPANKKPGGKKNYKTLFPPQKSGAAVG